MTDRSDTGAEYWLKEQLQRWQDIAQGITPQGNEQWQKFMSGFDGQSFPDLSEQQAELLNLVKRQSEHYTVFSESLLKPDPADFNAEQFAERFQKYMQQQCNEMLGKQWNLPEPFASLIKSTPLSAESVKKIPLRELLEQLAQSPDIGSGPFGQIQNPGQMRDISQALLDYQDALIGYLEQYDQIFNQTGVELKQILQQDDTEIDSIKALHNLWVDCYEKAYKDTVFTDSYQTSHGRISNSLMQVRKLAFSIRDKKLQEFGFVTREELNSTLKQQHRMRKQLRQQQQEITELRLQIDELVEALKQSPADNKMKTSRKRS
ncbi:poly(R)-hydroxyalkanoic acid synthase subunit PhaE [Amphritea sp. HPY]|uniref:poly(R)-hydroxyalkanoic acid synthase subunit PhaE n=1 Tax=Amphritea sp. HPY TaxID=3421652 RepID=UPI003D7C6226